jgi:hypothetical protein
MRFKELKTLAGVAGLAVFSSWSSSAEACGGFFCSQSAPVNQAAERIIFSENGDGTVTAVIQILYEGPAENFSWLLPISSVPAEGEDIALASDLAFVRLQNATNPSYRLTTTIEGQCSDGDLAGPRGIGGATASAGAPGSGGSANSPEGVMVEASGTIGAFDWTVISLNQSLADPADAAVTWLEENGFDVGDGAPGLIRPYLEDGLYLLALKLTKGSDTGSIRPIALTYDAREPMIPIKLTAVAANEDMGVMTWLLSSSRGVPRNYLSLELNEAKIDWFNSARNYNDVVIAAANEASGQGFVTEYADGTDTLAQAVWTQNDQALWDNFSSSSFATRQALFDTASSYWGSWDGFWDAVRATITLPAGATITDFQLCPSCYLAQSEFSPAGFVEALRTQVIEPVRMVQDLIDSRPYVTRLYTTMSAAEMTVDPLFTFNPDLEDVSNIHVATRVIECHPNVSQFDAPWRVELPQGGVIRGKGQPNGTWPAATQEQPSNVRITRLSSTGSGTLVEDNRTAIASMLNAYNGSLDPSTNPGSDDPALRGDGGGCRVGFGSPTNVGWLAAALAFFGYARRRLERSRRARWDQREP